MKEGREGGKKVNLFFLKVLKALKIQLFMNLKHFKNATYRNKIARFALIDNAHSLFSEQT